jgi:hypothetical protein
VTENKNQWDQVLLEADFSYSDSPNKSIGKIPFHILYGMHPEDFLS